MLHSENIDKIRTYLLYHGQQELAGHLDTLSDELRAYRSELEGPEDESTDSDANDAQKARTEREKSGFGTK